MTFPEELNLSEVEVKFWEASKDVSKLALTNRGRCE
jgi:hypothetical protein